MTNLIPTDEAHRIAFRLGVVRLIQTGLEATAARLGADPRDRATDAEQVLTEYELNSRTVDPERRLVEIRIDGTWLVEDVGTHTCGGDGIHHEPGCGSIPVTNLATLDGYAELAQYLDGDPTADHQCRSTHHAGGAGLRRCTWWHNHPNSRRHSDGSYTWTDETRVDAPDADQCTATLVYRITDGEPLNAICNLTPGHIGDHSDPDVPIHWPADQAGGMVLGPTEEAAALRSAPLANDGQCEANTCGPDCAGRLIATCQRSPWCDQHNGHTEPCNDNLAPF